MKKTAALKSWADVDDTLRRIALLNTHIDGKEAEMNKAILDVQKKFSDQTADSKLAKLDLECQVEGFCEEHREDFGGAKTKELTFGSVSFRLDTPSIGTMKGYTWDKVLKLLRKLKMDQFIRTKESVDKEAIKAQIVDTKDLSQLGLQIVQKESFAYECWERKL